MLAPKTLALIDAHNVANADNEFRNHCGASLIGKPCVRKGWYMFRWVLKEEFEPRMLRLFQRGHREEPVFLEYYKGIGMQVWVTNPEDVDPETGKERQFRVSALDGHFGGSLDGVAIGCPDLPCENPLEEPVELEMKTHNDKSFKKLVNDGLMNSKWEHFCQVQIYMNLLDLNFSLYGAVNKNDDALHFEIVRRDPAQSEKLLKRGYEIIYSPEPPKRISESPAYFECNYCFLRKLCHFGNVTPLRNCRTCSFSAPGKNGAWICSKNNPAIHSAPRDGCGQYKLNPLLGSK